MSQKQTVPMENPAPDEAVIAFPTASVDVARPPKWPIGKTLRLIVAVCGAFWFAVAIAVLVFLR